MKMNLKEQLAEKKAALQALEENIKSDFKRTYC